MSPQELFVGQVIMKPELFYELEVRSSDLTDARCRKVYESIGRILDRNDHVDFATIVVECPGVDASWLVSLTNELTPNVRRLAAAVVDESKRHRLSILARELVEQIQSEPTGEVLEHLETRLAEITEGRDDDVRPIKSSILPKVEEFERRYKNRGELPGMSSGVKALDDVTLGWGPSRLIVIGARPSEGKSALLLNFALSAAQAGHPVGVVSIESSRDELLERAFCNVGGIDGYSLRTGNYAASRMKDISDAATELSELPIYIADKPNMHLDELKSRCRRMVRVHGCKLLCIDYIQLVQMSGNLSDYERVSAVSVALKSLSRELEVPVIAAAQLHRGKDDTKRKPRLSDFKNSGQIEQDADVAILIYRRGSDNDEQTILCVEKNRDGLTRDVPVYFDKSRMRFAALDRRAA